MRPLRKLFVLLEIDCLYRGDRRMRFARQEFDLPAFSLKDVNGKTVSLADYKGRPVVVNFWATYCGPCREEMPWFQEFTQKYPGLVVLGLDEEDGVTVEQVKKAAARTAARTSASVASGRP